MRAKQYETKQVQASDLNYGDTILFNGEMKTVGLDTVKTGFCGTLVEGERMATVTQILFPKWFKGELLGYVAQP